MIKRIDLFIPALEQYGVLTHFTQKLKDALIRCGVSCRLLTAQHDNPGPFLAELLNDPPDCTLSFNGLLPDKEGRFFCDLLKIPHVACLVDSPNSFIPLVHSPYTIITCVDRFGCDFFRELHCDQVLFMPHGVEKNLSFSLEQERPYQILLLESCIDYEAIAEEWQSKYSPQICTLLHNAAEESLADEELSYLHTFVNLFNEHVSNYSRSELQNYDFIEMLDQLELYLRGIDRVRSVKSIKNARVELFGRSLGQRGWEYYLQGQNGNINYRGEVSFEAALQLMQQSKFLLHSCPWIKYGAHERIFSAMACGAVVISRSNPFLREEFVDGESILYLPHGNLDKQVADLIDNEQQRQHIAQNARKITMQKHTWDHRAAKLIKELSPIVERIKVELGVFQKNSSNHR